MHMLYMVDQGVVVSPGVFISGFMGDSRCTIPIGSSMRVSASAAMEAQGSATCAYGIPAGVPGTVTEC